VHSGASGARNIGALFFLIWWPGVVSIKSALGHTTQKLCFCIGCYLWVKYCILVRLRRKTLMHYFCCLGGSGADSIKSAAGHITSTLCFYIRCNRWVTSCIRGVKCRCTICHALFAQCGLHKKRTETRYAEVVFLHLVGSARHVVHFGASGVQNIDTLFFMLGWA
jgi:hypothetical protein